MTELEKMERARMYLEKLAGGINPLDDTPVAENDIVNNVRITRCLHYVTEVLRQVIDNGGIVPQPKEKKIPFLITNEQLALYPFSEEPLLISEITSRINSLIDSSKMRQLSANTITAWLVEEELLYVVTNTDGRTSKYPTENGQRFGITTEQRSNMYGTYIAVLYNSYAQMYILKNLQSIVEKHNEKRLQRNTPQP